MIMPQIFFFIRKKTLIKQNEITNSRIFYQRLSAKSAGTFLSGCIFPADNADYRRNICINKLITERLFKCGVNMKDQLH
ncbi:MAG: hypothetical protein J7J72_07125 [Bacteroidales bacterium]|nr:hypothetical protein [Bacteroidales bacterium]